MTMVELAYPVLGTKLPADNGYVLYAAISRALDHHLPDGIAILSIGGPRLLRNRIQIDRETRLRIRTSPDHIGALLPLAGKFLDLEGCEIGLGAPTVCALRPAPELVSRIVTIKGFKEPEPFLGAVRRQIESLGIAAQATIPVFAAGPRKGEFRRRVVAVKGRAIVGFALKVGGLSEQDSFTLLAKGLGGRRHMGCGIFTPAREQVEVGNAL
jgi:CRISPR-associated protein Cas6